MNLFEQAVRQQLRFNLNGVIGIEQLYASYNKPSAKVILRQYAAELKASLDSFKGFDVFDEEAVKSKEQDEIELRLAIIKLLYAEIKEVEKANSEAKSRKEIADKAKAVLLKRQESEFENLSDEELLKLIND